MSDKKNNIKDEQEKRRESINRADEHKVEIERENKNEEFEEAEEEYTGVDTDNVDLITKVNELEEQVGDLKDQLLRKAAEFENFKRRTENEQVNYLKYASESLIVKILPIYDDLRRSLEHADSNNNDSLIKGIKLVYDKFSKVLKDEGVEKIEAKGKEFDFNLHEALMQKDVEGIPPHTVIDEIEPGYMYKDKVIRHAKVIVSQESTSDE